MLRVLTGCALWKALKRAYARAPWETQSFEHCGVRLIQHEDYGISLDHASFNAKVYKDLLGFREPVGVWVFSVGEEEMVEAAVEAAVVVVACGCGSSSVVWRRLDANP